MKGKKVAARIVFMAGLAGLLWFLQMLLQPKYMGRVVEGNLIPEYYQEKTDHALIILGDCEVYENISPIVLWEEFGISSYIRGSAQQLIPQSYYILKDTLRREKPKVVLLSVSAMQEGKQTNEAYNRMTMEGLAWSMDKLNMIEETKMEDEYLLEYIFPLLRYHSRWKELEKDDIQYLFHRGKVSHNGYYMRSDIRPLADFPEARRRADYRFSPEVWAYMEKIRLLCEAEEIQLILFKAPSLYPVWYDQWEEQIQDYARLYDLTYISCIPEMEEIGLDFQTDTYDGGMHMNVYGAEKLTRYLGECLAEASELEDQRQDEELVAIWGEKQEFYRQMRKAQEAEIKEFGYLRQFTDGKK